MNAISGPFEDGKTKAAGKDGAQGTTGVFETIGISGEEVSKGIGASRMHGVAGNAGAAAETETAGAAGAPARTGFPGAIEVSGDAGAFGGKTGKSANVKRLEARLRGLVGKAIVDYRMIEDGDRVMACVSGGKDSHAMVHMLVALARNAPVNFEVVAVNLDQKQPGFPSDVLPAYFASRGIPFESIEQDTYGIVKRVLPEGKTMCGLCSRLRRGVLYRHAAKRGFTRIALGHHRDDIIETLFMNMFHGGRLRAMPPKLRSDDGRHIVIRPLAYCAENDLHRLARAMRFPIIPCNLCGSQDGLERQRIKTMLAQWERESPGRTAQIFRALQHVGPSHLADRALFDFESLRAGRPPAREGLHQVAANRS